MDFALNGFKVVDLTQGIAGPYCTKLFADFGADVIKVEKPGVGDISRRAGPFPNDIPDRERSGLFLYLNTNKKSVTIDIKTAAGKKLLRRLVAEADLLVESYRPATRERLGLDYDALSAENPKLVMVSVSSFGQTGAYRDCEATELTLEAAAGGVYPRGDRDKAPIKLGGAQLQYMGGVSAFIAALGALFQRDMDGKGQYVDVSIAEAMASNLEGAHATYAYLGLVKGRVVSRYIFGHPVGYYPCKDGYVGLMPGLGGMEALALLLGKPELEDEPLFKDHRLRQERADEFDQTYLLPFLKEHDKRELEQRGQELRMPFAAVLSPGELLGDPQFKAREFFVTVDYPRTGPLTYPGAPFKLGETGFKVGKAPELGEHNTEVFCRMLGYAQEDLVRLRGQGVI